MDESFNNGNEPFGEFNGQPNNNWQQPYVQQPQSQPAPTAPTKGKPFAIIAFVFAMVAMVAFSTATLLVFEVEAAQAFADMNSNSSVHYYVVNAEEVLAMAGFFSIVSIIFALVSDILVIFAYIGHAQNVKNGVRAKYILVFAIIATVVANLSLFISLISLI